MYKCNWVKCLVFLGFFAQTGFKYQIPDWDHRVDPNEDDIRRKLLLEDESPFSTRNILKKVPQPPCGCNSPHFRSKKRKLWTTKTKILKSSSSRMRRFFEVQESTEKHLFKIVNCCSYLFLLKFLIRLVPPLICNSWLWNKKCFIV